MSGTICWWVSVYTGVMLYVLFSVPVNSCLWNFRRTAWWVHPKSCSWWTEGWCLQNKKVSRGQRLNWFYSSLFLQTHLPCDRQGAPEQPYSSVVCHCIVSNLKPYNLFNDISLLSLQNLCEKYSRSLDLIFSDFFFFLNSMCGMCFMYYISSVDSSLTSNVWAFLYN